AVVREAQIEFDRDLDEPEHAQRTAHPEVPGQRGGDLGAPLLALQGEVDAGHDVDLATGDTDVDGCGRPELQRRLQLFHPGRVELEVEEPTAGEQAHAQQD